MRILITGGAGFIGSNLVEKLLFLKHKVIVVDNFDDFYHVNIKCKNVLDSIGQGYKINKILHHHNKEDKIKNLIFESKEKNYRLYFEDIRNYSKMEEILFKEKPEIIINLAALAGVNPSLNRALDYENVNVGGMLTLLEICKKFNIKKFIQASSSSVYGNNKKVPYSEKDTVDFPISPYAASKKNCEIFSYPYHHLYNINIIHLRFFTVYGQRQRPDLAIRKFTNLIYNNEEIPFYGDGTSSRDYTYIEDILDGIVSSIKFLIDNKNIYEIINLGNSNPISLKDMVTTLENALKIKANIKYLPMQPGDVFSTYADITKAWELFKYQPKTNFDSGVEKFIKWFKTTKEVHI